MTPFLCWPCTSCHFLAHVSFRCGHRSRYSHWPLTEKSTWALRCHAHLLTHHIHSELKSRKKAYKHGSELSCLNLLNTSHFYFNCFSISYFTHSNIIFILFIYLSVFLWRLGPRWIEHYFSCISSFPLLALLFLMFYSRFSFYHLLLLWPVPV